MSPAAGQRYCSPEGGVAKGSRKNKLAFWRERRAGRCKAPRRRRCGDIVEERQRRRCPPAAAPLRAAARRPAGCVARSLHTAAAELYTQLTPWVMARTQEAEQNFDS